MNIFYLSESPKQCAEWMVDKHCVKMILETAQLLCTAHRVLDGTMSVNVVNGRKKKVYALPNSLNEVMYSATHINHPSAVWARETNSNYMWLHQHLLSLLEEYTFRYDKKHKVELINLHSVLRKSPNNIRIAKMTVMPSCMDDKYKVSEDPIENYRNYYREGKKHLHNWKRRSSPEWINI